MRKTCGGCPHLKENRMPRNSGLFMGCGLTDTVIPHSSSRSEDGQAWEVIFWRVPTNCPLPDSEVVKSETKANPKDWVEVNVDV